MRRCRRVGDRPPPSARITEDYATPEVVASRRGCYEPAIRALVDLIPKFLTDSSRNASRAFGATRKRIFPKTAFSAKEASDIIGLYPSPRAPQRLRPTTRAHEVDQSRVNPLRRFYEFPATWEWGSTTYLRQLRPEERVAVVLYALTDFALANRERLRRQRYGDGYVFVIPSAHGEAAPPSVEPLASSREPRASVYPGP